MGIPDHLTCLLRNLYAGQEATVRTGHGTTDWFQIGKGVHQGCILSPCLFNLYAEYIMRNTGLEDAHAGLQFAGRRSLVLRKTRPSDDGDPRLGTDVGRESEREASGHDAHDRPAPTHFFHILIFVHGFLFHGYLFFT